ncbi:hypothetical protein J3E72DRAFT_36421 [Bipolaris maydis]|nr:hypothetical protein J3E74DRAFT_31769 [Bipolaris maydis]KAJ5062507.1 hypothetical protein J3E74DRAFT_32960 [Bipolaris maydis]KAJ6198780.1 hypothetical protein J3E72DRAFT_36421 [Bipolaris maydis]KAJ6283060.1 hypothetical protein J3E71DRAFT_34451 [Bipolaris maydis]
MRKRRGKEVSRIPVGPFLLLGFSSFFFTSLLESITVFFLFFTRFLEPTCLILSIYLFTYLLANRKWIQGKVGLGRKDGNGRSVRVGGGSVGISNT